MTRKVLFLLALVLASPIFAAPKLIERWEKAAGGHKKLAAVHAIYREGTIKFGELEGTIKVWHTAEGKYRKEERFPIGASIETFDGTNAISQRGMMPARKLEGSELAIAKSKAFANSNAMFFVFFPERHRGTLNIEGDDTVIFAPEGGIEWRVTLDPATSLPKSMTHQEGDKTINVEFVSYETIDGLQLESEIHRSMGTINTVIHFTKTVINPQVEDSMFTQ